MKRTLVNGILLVALVAAGCHRAAPEEEAQPVVSVQVAKAEIAPIAQPLDLTGTITARQEAAVSPKISGQITSMALLKNQFVRAGEVIARLEARDLAAQRAEASAAVTTANDAIAPAEAALENARRTYERRKGLYEKGGISKKDLEASQLDVENAAGTLKTARSKIAEANSHRESFDAQLDYSLIRAPFDGIVTDQFAHQGDFAQAGTKLLTIADVSTVIVKAPLSDEAATHVHPGDAVTVQPDDLPGTTINGRVTLVSRAADPQSRAVEVWVTLPNGDGRMRPNGAAHVTIASNGVGSAVVIPSAALTLDATNANGGTVMVVDAKSIAHEVHVTVGAHDRDRAQIVSGLRGGETVVTVGNYGLPDGAKVTVGGS
jgi:RND family efflux transporter MFP subunit